jgi:CarD family transcriptional regulator
MTYQIGEKVIHSLYGFAEIIGIENKDIQGVSQQYYVVKTKEMSIWVPTSENITSKLRLPSSKNDFLSCFDILKSKYSPFSSDRYERKTNIQTKLNIGSLDSMCELIRDLSFYKSQNKLNDTEKSILEKIMLILLDEWRYVFNITNSQARSELNKLLSESYASSL